MVSKLLVFGGNGFLGKRICQEAVNNGFQVMSLSRSGRPPKPQSPRDKDWIGEVQWEAADVFDPLSYNRHLRDATDVVHSLGILLEDESYKVKVRNPLNKSFDLKSLIPSFGPNPLDKKNPNFTYERMNKESALILAQAFRQALSSNEDKRGTMPTFTYISADKGFPLIPKGYINSKRQAEAELMRYESFFRPILVRPGFMFDEYKTTSDARSYVHNGLELLNCGNRVLLRNKLHFVNELIRPTISTQQVSRSIVSKIKDPSFSGILSLDSMLSMS